MAQGLRLHAFTAKGGVRSLTGELSLTSIHAEAKKKKKHLNKKGIKEAMGKSKKNPFLRARQKLDLSPRSTNYFVFLAGLGVVCLLNFSESPFLHVQNEDTD